jgi:hypothetical protein
MEAGDRLAERQAGKQRESRMTGKQHKNGHTDRQPRHQTKQVKLLDDRQSIWLADTKQIDRLNIIGFFFINIYVIIKME